MLAIEVALMNRAFGAEARQYLPKLWQTDNGLPQNTILAIAQTEDGYLWVGTRAGLDRFDGERFTLVDHPELKDHAITALCGARDGSLWIGMESEGLIHWDGEHLTHYWRTNGLGNDYIRTICEARDGTIWIGTGYGLTSFKDGKFKTYRVKDGLLDNSVIKMVEDGDGTLWMGTVGGVNSMKNGIITGSYTFDTQLPNNTVNALAKDSTGNVWFGTTGGMGQLRGGKLERTYQGAKGLPGHFVSALFVDRRGTLWVGTFGGLFRLADDGSFITEFNADGSAYDQVLAIYEDREGNIWVGGRDGLSRLRPRPAFSITKRQGLSENNVMAVCEDESGTMWAASWGGGLDQATARKSAFTPATNKFATDLMLSLTSGGDGSLWVGTDHGSGMYQLKDGLLKHYGKKEGLTNLAIRAIHEDRNTNLWIAMTGALAVYKNGKFVNYTSKDGLAGNTVRAILEDAKGGLWFGCEYGLVCWRDGKFVNFPGKDSLSNQLVLALHEDKAGSLWIGTVGSGVFRLRNGKVTNYGTKDGLFSDDAFEILEDDYGYLWMSCFEGLYRVSKKAFADFDGGKDGPIPCASYGKSEGMASVQCNGVGQPSGWKSRDGRLWFPTTKGIAVMDPGVQVNAMPPPVAIEEIIVAQTNLTPPLRRMVAMPPGGGTEREIFPELKIAPGVEELEIHYTALSLQAPEKIRFKYQLEGAETEWKDAGSRRTAYYNNLPPGHYRFRVRACNNDGVWNENAATASLFLQPHFWQTWWFGNLTVLGAIGLVAVSAGYMVRKKSRRELQKMEQQHMLERERARIAKDIHDDLGSSLTRITMLSELVEADKADSREVETHARKIAMSARETVRSLDEIVWAVSPEKDTWNSLVEYISQYAKDFFEGTGVLCRLELPLDLPAYPLSSEARHGIYLVVKEALNNIVKHAQAKEARLRVRQNGERMEIEIVDDGRGFEPDGPRTGRQGSGLQNMRARMESLGGQFRVESGPGKGTRLTLTIRLDADSK